MPISNELFVFDSQLLSEEATPSSAQNQGQLRKWLFTSRKGCG